jgi:MFS family permease
VTEGAATGAMRGDEVGVGCEGGVMKWAPSDEGSSSGWWGRYLGWSIVGTLVGLLLVPWLVYLLGPSHRWQIHWSICFGIGLFVWDLMVPCLVGPFVVAIATAVFCCCCCCCCCLLLPLLSSFVVVAAMISAAVFCCCC